MAGKQQKINIKKQKETKKGYTPPSEVRLHLMPYLLVLIAFFLLLCIFATSFTGVVGKYLKNILAGLFSWGIYLIPLLLVFRAFLYRKEATSRFRFKGWIFSTLVVVAVAALVATINVEVKGFNVISHFKSAIDNGHITTGSLFGGLIANALSTLIGPIPTGIILALTALIAFPLTVNKTPLDLARFVVKIMKKGKEKSEEVKKAREEYFDKKEKEEKEKTLKEAEKAKKKESFEVDVEEPKIEENIEEEVQEEKKNDLQTIFAQKEDPEVTEKFSPDDNDDIEEIAEETDISPEGEIETEVNYVRCMFIRNRWNDASSISMAYVIDGKIQRKQPPYRLWGRYTDRN